MQSFTDKTGDAWTIKFTVLTRMNVRARHDIDIAKMLRQDMLTRFADEPELLVAILWVCIEDQATARGLTLDDFLATRLDEETLEVATELLFDERVEYAPKKNKAALRKIVRTYRKSGTAMQTAWTKTIESISDDSIDAAAREIEALAATKSPSGNSNSPASVA